MNYIVDIVTDFYGVYSKKVFVDDRRREVVKCRQVSMYIMRQLTKFSHNEIGDFFRKDHSSVAHSLKTLEKDMETNGAFRMEVNLLLSQSEKKMRELSITNRLCNPMIYSRIVRRYKAYS